MPNPDRFVNWRKDLERFGLRLELGIYTRELSLAYCIIDYRIGQPMIEEYCNQGNLDKTKLKVWVRWQKLKTGVRKFNRRLKMRTGA